MRLKRIDLQVENCEYIVSFKEESAVLLDHVPEEDHKREPVKDMKITKVSFPSIEDIL
jgi:hypothetical protein